MLRRLARYKKLYGVEKGAFFKEFKWMVKTQSDADDDLRKYSLMPENMNVEIDDQLRERMRQTKLTLDWQFRQMNALEDLEMDQAQSDPAKWDRSAVDVYLLRCGVVDEESLQKLPTKKRVLLSRDLAALHRVFKWTFENMPDDEEAKEISRQRNIEDGYPPPSPPPPPPPLGPDEL